MGPVSGATQAVNLLYEFKVPPRDTCSFLDT